MTRPARHLVQVFAVAQPDLSVTPVQVGPMLFAELGRDFDGFRGGILVSEFAFSADWTTGECQPVGDKIVILLVGQARFMLCCGGADATGVWILLNRTSSYPPVSGTPPLPGWRQGWFS